MPLSPFIMQRYYSVNIETFSSSHLVSYCTNIFVDFIVLMGNTAIQLFLERIINAN